ncbi:MULTISPECIES: DUF2079 domain-containing protein [unclassified Coleofasciculus]|uniref:DUF2079 domain-containing protein n=1 Tax=unclassified Coleofasciculus TaxID=2692782 RepID=UPI00187FFA96|nr:DUF2079 domain-containing protein [Coleofasciculus sp. LEGE 07092]MBE9128119.1 DUF2079 domain-containing protein [Coleofasciculus sp. LEGE 07081]MBE9151191.1 DUF2079 domain-containing protein [Coleofasciculus sp. LEGE 07092]
MVVRLQKVPAIKTALTKPYVIASITFFLLALILTLHRHYTFYSSYDQGIFNQVFWNSLHGRFFESSLSSQLSTNVVHQGEIPDVSYHRLGQHFTPALLLWLPLYALFPFPATLTVLQVSLVTAAGLVLYILAREYLQPPLATLITISFYCANAIVGPTLSNFHDICQIPLFMFGLLLAMEKRWWWLFWVLVVLILAVREDAGVGLFGVGIYLILSQRYPRVGLAVCTLSFGYMILLTNLIMPLFSEDISQRFMIERFGQYADGEEASTLEIIWGMISNPWRLLVELVTPFGRTLNYLLGQWLPLAFVPALSPAAWAIAGFPLLKLFLGQGQSVLAINIRYAMTVVPGLFYGAILWWSQHPGFFKKSLFRRFWSFCIGLTLFFSFTSSNSALNRPFYFLLPDSFDPWVHISLPQQWHHVAQMRPLLAQIPPDASVAATTYIIPHLSGRREIIRLPALELRNDNREVVKVDYGVADLWQLQQYQVAFDEERGLLQNMVTLIDKVTDQGEYGILRFQDGVILLQKGGVSNREATDAWLAFRQKLS